MDASPHALDPAAAAVPLAPAAPPAASALDERAAVFARTPPREKAALLRATIPHALAAAPEMVAAACTAAGVDPAGPLAGAAWLAGPVALVAAMRRYAEALEDIAGSGRPALPLGHLRTRLEGRVVARLAPRSFAEQTLYRGSEANALFAADVAPEQVIAGQATFYRQSAPGGGTVHVLDAGGPPAAGALGALSWLFVEGKVVRLELAPARAGLPSILERALAPLVQAGFLEVALGADVGGAPGGGPVIVVPAFYAKDEISFVARRLAAEIAAGAAFGVDAPRAVVLSGCWAQRALFTDHLERALAALPREVSRPLVALAEGAAPPAGVVSLVEAGCEDPVAMLAAAVDRCNAWPRTTTAELVVHPLHGEEPEVAAAMDRAAVALRCDALGVDQWPAVITFRGDMPAGPRMLTHVDKTIVHGPLIQARRPAYFCDHRRGAELGARLAAFQAGPSLGAALRL